MKRKSRSERNLTKRNGVWYYQRIVNGKRIQFSLKTGDLKRAKARRDLYEKEKGIGRFPFEPVQMPRFSEFAERYLTEATKHLAPTTLGDRRALLKPEGVLTAYFGRYHLDEIRRRTLLEWWYREVEAAGRSRKTGKNLVDCLAAVFAYAADVELLEVNPIDTLRAVLRRRSRTKQGRHEGSGAERIRPIDNPDELKRLLERAQEAGTVPLAAVLLLLDAGLRIGELAGLTWGQIVWGRDENDVYRALVIDRSRPRGGAVSTPKSGRERRVALSRRLRRCLAELHMAQGRPESEVPLFPTFHPSNFNRRVWQPLCRKAKIGARQPKDLRDSFASWLLSLGAPIAWVQTQLGHSDWSTTARHYGRWIEAAAHRPPPALLHGEVWPDLLSRLEVTSPVTSVATDVCQDPDAESSRNPGGS
jgi:integrase